MSRRGLREVDVTVRRLVTPEGVPLELPIASAADRVGAFGIDCILVIGGIFVVGFLTSVVGGADSDVGMSLALVSVFLLRNFYFAGLELAWRGQTIGKRMCKLRVVDTHGAGLTAEAVLARNLLREVETFVPLFLLFFPDDLWPGAAPYVRVIAGLWVVCLVALPLLNADRRRAGDFVAGTMVVSMRETALAHDLSQSSGGSARHGAHAFTKEQLERYGEHELHVLEDLLRRPIRERRKATRVVAEKIRKKIGWQGAFNPADDDAFLRDFYAAQRRELEREMLFGRRYGDKFERTGD